MIPPDENADFVCQMEQVLDVYHRPYDPLHPVVCMDESPTQLIGETRRPYIDQHGVQREDYEYRREGVASIFMAVEPLTGDQTVEARDSHTAKDYAVFMEKVAAKYPEATTVTIVQDNLSTHKASAFYQCFPPEKAKALVDKFRFVYTPKHGSWLNIAEIALNVLMNQCLNRRMPDKETMKEQIEAWLKDRDAKKKPIDWQFGITDARAKLKRLYPKF
jgi:hypothetical protein